MVDGTLDCGDSQFSGEGHARRFVSLGGPARRAGGSLRDESSAHHPSSIENSISNRNIMRLETHLSPAKSLRAARLIATNDDMTKVVVLRDRREPRDLSRKICFSRFDAPGHSIFNRRKIALRTFDLSRSQCVESIRKLMRLTDDCITGAPPMNRRMKTKKLKKMLGLAALSLTMLFPQAAQLAAQDQPKDAKPAEAKPAEQAPPKEESSATDHTIRLGGQAINYKATASTTLLKDDKGEPTGSIFSIAYTRADSKDMSQRPLAFVYERQGKLFLRTSSKTTLGSWTEVGECTTLDRGAAPDCPSSIRRRRRRWDGESSPSDGRIRI